MTSVRQGKSWRTTTEMERQSSSQRMRAQWQKGEEKRHSMYIIDNCCITAKAMAGVQKKSLCSCLPIEWYYCLVITIWPLSSLVTQDLKTAVLTLKLSRLQKEDQCLGLGLNLSLLALPFLVSLQPPSVSFDLIANCNNVQSSDLHHCNMLIHGYPFIQKWTSQWTWVRSLWTTQDRKPIKT